MNKKNTIFGFIIIILLFIITLVLIYSLSDSFYTKVISYFSVDQSFKTVQNINAIKSLLIKFLLSGFIVSIAVLLSNVVDLSEIKSRYLGVIDKIKSFFIKNKNLLSRTLIAFLLIYLIFSSLALIFNVDVGADEGGQISKIKGFYDYGKFQQPYLLDRMSWMLHLVYIPFLLLKYIIPFSIPAIRIVALIWSLLLIWCSYKILTKLGYRKSFPFLFILLASDIGFIYLSSSAYGELGATLFLVLGTYFRTEKELNHRNVFLSALFFAIAGIQKIQLLPFIFIVNLIYLLITDKKWKNFLLLFYLISIWFIENIGFSVMQGFSLSEIGRGFWAIFGASGQMFGKLDLILRLSRINYLFNIQSLVIYAVIITYFIFNYKRTSKFEKFLFSFSILISLLWITSLQAISTRNVYYAIYLNYFLLSIIIYNIYTEINQINLKRYVFSTVVLLLIFNLAAGATQNLRLIKKGIMDEYQYTNAGFETFNRGTIEKSAQREFFEYINSHLMDEELYSVGVNFYWYTFTDKKYISVDKNALNEIRTGSYFILTYIDYKNQYITDELEIFLHNNSEIIYKNGYWEIYKIIENKNK